MENSGKDRSEMSFLQHLEALRWHLVRSAFAVLAGGLLAFAFKSVLFDVIIFGPKTADFVTYRLMCQWGGELGFSDTFCFDELPFRVINTKMAGQFSTHIWISLLAGIILAFPYIVWEMWRFVSPGLRESERSVSRGTVAVISLLFAIGVCFGYFVISPLSVQFLGSYAISADVGNFIDLMSYISTVSTVTLACGIIFELPVLVYFLTRIGLLTPQWMRTYRRHALVVTLVLAAVITPPDLSSQVLVAVPIVILYEISILISARVMRKNEAIKAKD